MNTTPSSKMSPNDDLPEHPTQAELHEPASSGDLAAKLSSLPRTPGVYLMKDPSGAVIYVGKASVLRSRVRSYFQASAGKEARIRRLVDEIADFEVIRTKTEAEAFLLEDTLIKRHQPRFNVRLRDDKRYPYLKITNEPYPRVLIARRRREDRARYFGPYTNVKAMRSTLKLAQKLFPIRTCSLALPLGSPRRPCLNYHIGRCLAPCAELVTPREYAQIVDGASLLFEGRVTGLIQRITAEMEEAASAKNYEKAARHRDQVLALRNTLERQAVALSDLKDRDAIGLYIDGSAACANVFQLRDGRLSGRIAFHLRVPDGATTIDVLPEFLSRFYSAAHAVPPEILLPAPMDEDATAALSSWLTSKRGKKVRLHTPQRGEKRDVIRLAEENARYAYKAERAAVTLQSKATSALSELAEVLSLSTFPQRIEAYDISNIQGTEATGSMVVFINGRSRRDAYRRFKIQAGGHPDDYAMMAEVLRRRFRRGLKEISDPTVSRGKFSELPDLVIVDGGKGQLNVARSVCSELDLEGIELLGLAKRHEEVFRPARPLPLVLAKDGEALLLLRQIRDEAHRFAITYHRNLRRKRTLSSTLDAIPGIGPKRRSALLRRFGSLKGLSAASADEIALVPGISRDLADRIHAAVSQ
ncbi:excinuclease ABC subunit UvrC [Candidatus Bipolaricaulota bacterium]|nr:excinuclease ABC subunit UvrC [Candidatus Bipolaricaulota bacterium]